MGPRQKWVCVLLGAIAASLMRHCLRAPAPPGDALAADASASAPAATAPLQLDEAALERDCPGFGVAYMLGVMGGRCKDVGDFSTACVCRTVCPRCAAGSASAGACREQLRCGDVSYWRHGNATVEGYMRTGLAFY